MEFKPGDIHVESPEITPSNPQAVGKVDIPIQYIAKSEVSRSRRVGADRDPSGNDIPIGHQNINPLESLVYEIKAVPLTK